MNNCLKRIIYIALLYGISSNFVTKISSLEDFHTKIQQLGITAVIFFDSRLFENKTDSISFQKFLVHTCQALNEAAQREQVNSSFYWVDLSEVERLKSLYAIDSENRLIIFSLNKFVEYKHFQELRDRLESNFWVSQLSSFIFNRARNCSRPILSIEDISNSMKENKFLYIFFAVDDSKAALFRQLCSENIDLDFAHSFDLDLLTETVIRYSLKEKLAYNDPPMVLLLKSNKALNEFDREPMVFFTQIDKLKEFRNFVRLEAQNKLKLDSDSNSVLIEIQIYQTPVLLYIRASEQNWTNYSQFRQSIKSLPKLMVFATVSVDNASYSDYLSLFLTNYKNLEEENVYLILSGGNNELTIINYSGAIDSEDIVVFVLKNMRHLHSNSQAAEPELESEAVQKSRIGQFISQEL